MSDTKVVGRFHCDRVVDGLPVALSQWRVTTHERAAAVVVRLLAGEVVECCCADSGWEVLTEAKKVRIVVESVAEMMLLFRLADARELGVFEFRCEAWTLVEWLGEGAVGLAAGVLGELGIEPVMLTTVNGMLVRYLLPSLRVPGNRKSVV